MLVLTSAWLTMRYCRWVLQYCGGSEKWSHLWVPCGDGALLPPRQPATAGATQPPYVSVCVFCGVESYVCVCGMFYGWYIVYLQDVSRFEVASLGLTAHIQTSSHWRNVFHSGDPWLGQLYILMLYLLVHKKSCCFEDSEDSCSGILGYDLV